MLEKKNYYEIDLLKFTMAVCVVAIHTQPLYGIQSVAVQRLFDTITSLAVPYFFSVSGFLLFSKIDADISSEKNMEVCKKYLSRVLSLYVIWNIIYLPITIFGFKENNMSFARYVLDCIRGFLFIGQQFYSWQLWYLLSVFFVIASICIKSYDGRFSHSNKEWAEQVSTPEHNADRMTFRTDWVVDSHPAILDGFVTMFRKELEAQKEQEQPFVKQFYVVENLQAAPLKIERFGNLDDAMSQYQALPNHCMKALGVEKNPDPLPGSLDILQCKNGIDTIVEDYKTVPGWDNPYIQNHVVQPLQGALAVQDVELAYKLPDAYFHIQTCDDGFDYTLYNKDFTERDGGILETDGDKPVQEAMTELLAEFGCDAAQGRVMDAAELREQADTVAEQQAEALKEKLAAERPAPEETLSFYVAECLEFTFAGEFHDHLTMEEALEVYDKIPSERMNADKCIGFCIEEDGGFVGMYELVVNDKVQRENINSINYFRDDKLVQQAISDMEKLMAARQQSKEQERGSTKKSVLDALRSLKAKKQEQPAQEQDKPKKAKKKGMEL